MNKKALLEFVKPYYSKKDEMHDLSHINRLLHEARSISKKYQTDGEILTCATYFHGIDGRRHRGNLTEFLVSQGLPRRKAVKILRVASESHKESRPRTIEGKILHDAHLVVGGRTLMVANFLVTGALRGFPIEHTINYFEKEVDGRFKCHLPEMRQRYSEMEGFTREFFRDLRDSLSHQTRIGPAR